MDFFKNIDAMQVQGEWVICIKQSEPERMTVSVYFKDDKCGDDARRIVPPLIFPDKTVTELDNHIFDDLNSVIPDTAKMFSSMEQYLKQREEARKQSAMEREKMEKEKKVQQEQKKKYEEAMKKVDELEAAGKYREAFVKVPDPSDFPEYAEALRKRKEALTAKFEPNLFNA